MAGGAPARGWEIEGALRGALPPPPLGNRPFMPMVSDLEGFDLSGGGRRVVMAGGRVDEAGDRGGDVDGSVR